MVYYETMVHFQGMMIIILGTSICNGDERWRKLLIITRCKIWLTLSQLPPTGTKIICSKKVGFNGCLWWFLFEISRIVYPLYKCEHFIRPISQDFGFYKSIILENLSRPHMHYFTWTQLNSSDFNRSKCRIHRLPIPQSCKNCPGTNSWLAFLKARTWMHVKSNPTG